MSRGEREKLQAEDAVQPVPLVRQRAVSPTGIDEVTAQLRSKYRARLVDEPSALELITPCRGITSEGMGVKAREQELGRLQDYERRHPRYPCPPGDGAYRVACTDKEEYLSSSRFATGQGILCHPYTATSGMLTPLMLLLLPEDELTYSITGRWHGMKLMSGWQHGTRNYGYVNGKAVNIYTHIGHTCKDISHEVCTEMERNWPTFMRVDGAVDFRNLVATVQPTPGNDFTHVTVDNLWQLRERCKRLGKPTWTRLRQWLLRRKLTNIARRALGGRPQRRKRKLQAGGRALRRIKTDRHNPDVKT